VTGEEFAEFIKTEAMLHKEQRVLPRDRGLHRLLDPHINHHLVA